MLVEVKIKERLLGEVANVKRWELVHFFLAFLTDVFVSPLFLTLTYVQVAELLIKEHVLLIVLLLR